MPTKNPKVVFTDATGAEGQGRMSEVPLDALSVEIHGVLGSDFKARNVPEHLRAMRGLVHLEIGSSPIRALPPWLPELESLESLKLLTCRLTTTGGLIAKLPRLRRLELCDKGMDVSETFADIAASTVTELIFRDDALTSTPSELFDLVDLRELGFYSGKLVRLTDDFAKLTQLKALSLGGRFSTLPDSIGELSLESFEVSFSKLKSLPTSVAHLDVAFNLGRVKPVTPTEPPKPPAQARPTRADRHELVVRASSAAEVQEALDGLDEDQRSSLRRIQVDAPGAQFALPSAIGDLPHITALTLRDTRPDDAPSLAAMTSLVFVLLAGEAVKPPEKRAFKKRLPDGGRGWRQTKHTRGFCGELIYERSADSQHETSLTRSRAT